MKYVLIGLLKLYRLVISPLYGNVCKYYPTCSAYALRAVQVHGAARGTWLTARRLLRCHPWAPGGYDPVPGTPEFEEEQRSPVESSPTSWSESTLRPTEHNPGTRLEQSEPPPQLTVPHHDGAHDHAAMAAQPRGVN